MEPSKNADESVVRVAHLMPPEWANFFGNIHGGQVLRLVDNTAYVCAARYAGTTTCVTAAMDRVDFYEPVHVGELLTIVARIAYVGRSSMEVDIDIFAQDIPSGRERRTNTCHVTMVALKDGRPTQVPRLICRTPEDKARYIQARKRREMGLRYRQERDAFLSQYERMTAEELDALIAESAG